MQPTVRDKVYEFLRARGTTTAFGNPGITEINFRSGMPGDFNYILGLQESVVAIARGDDPMCRTARP